MESARKYFEITNPTGSIKGWLHKSLRLEFKFLLALTLIVFQCNYAQALDVNVNLGITGANAGLDASTPRWWNFTVTSAGAAQGLIVVTGNITIKKQQSASSPVVFSLWSGFTTNGSTSANSLLATMSMSASSLTQQFTPTIFSFNPVPSQLGVGAYSLTLTTLDSGAANTGYGLKYNDTVQMTTTGGTPLSSSYYASAGANPTPYPSPSPSPGPSPTPGPGPTPSS
jgi:hypothetical protein